MNPSPSPTCVSRGDELLTFGIVTTGSILFCSKGVFAKLSYAHGLDPISVLNLRMTFSLPFFAAIALVSAPGLPRLPATDWLRLLGLGFLGYYLSSLVNFSGLQYVTVGLERVILFTYPTIVLVLTALVLRKRVAAKTWFAACIAWAGIVCAFGGEARTPVAGGNLPLGASLIFASALLYAVFIITSGETIKRIGSLLFASLAVGSSCIFVIVHFAIAHGYSDIVAYPAPVFRYAAILALFGTVAPALLMSLGLKRAGPQHFAVMGAAGPIVALFLAWALLNEVPNLFQGVGLLLALSGGVAIALCRREDQ